MLNENPNSKSLEEVFADLNAEETEPLLERNEELENKLRQCKVHLEKLINHLSNVQMEYAESLDAGNKTAIQDAARELSELEIRLNGEESVKTLSEIEEIKLSLEAIEKKYTIPDDVDTLRKN